MLTYDYTKDLLNLQGVEITKIEKSESKQAATVREKQELLKKQKTLNIFRQNFTVLLSEQSSQIYPS